MNLHSAPLGVPSRTNLLRVAALALLLCAAFDVLAIDTTLWRPSVVFSPVMVLTALVDPGAPHLSQFLPQSPTFLRAHSADLPRFELP
jgi:hypothetical protein